MGRRVNSNLPAFKIICAKVKARPNISLASLTNEMRGYVSKRTGQPLSVASLSCYLSTARNLPENAATATA